MMKILVIGAGAIGGIIGAYLTAGGCDVVLTDTDADHVQAMQEKGLQIITPDETKEIRVNAYTVDAYLDILKESRPLECVILSVKAQFTRSALEPFLPYMNENSFVISVQNGLCEYEIAGLVGEDRTVAGFVNIFSDYLEPGVINYGGKGALALGELDGRISPRMELLEKTLVGLDQLEISENLMGYLWGKLSYAAVLGATSLSNATMADTIENPHYRKMLLDLAAETVEAAEYEGIRLKEFDDFDPCLTFPREKRDLNKVDEMIGRHVARLRTYTKVHSGIWRDMAVRRRKTEIGALLAPALEKGQTHGLRFPLTRLMLEMIAGIEAGERQFSADNLEILVEKDLEVYR